MIPTVSVVGRKNSGKTTLIEKIIPELKKRRYRVGMVKHHVHQFELDHEGKDTWRMAQAGADTVVIASDEKIGMVKKLSCEQTVDEISQWLLQDVDIAITEGYKRQDKPKIEVTRSGELLCTREDNLLAIIDNTNASTCFHLPDGFGKTPCFRINDVEKVVDLIEERFLAQEKDDSLR